MIPEKGLLLFTSPQKAMVFTALEEAEERTTDYYCIPPFRWEKLHYDLLTREDHGWEPLPDPMLARVRLLRGKGKRKDYDFYRIELNDHGILTAARRENLTDSSELYPFLVYILTHEMVHMVRLSTILDDWAGIKLACNETEEHRVQGISNRILSGYSDLLPRLHKFCSPTSRSNSLSDRSEGSMEIN
ncbi:MAG: hypothetical protein JW793_05520 [Acidobacteria bacterium]|nr:hypothetical protein [Acidobacteriota bacterium]